MFKIPSIRRFNKSELAQFYVISKPEAEKSLNILPVSKFYKSLLVIFLAALALFSLVPLSLAQAAGSVFYPPNPGAGNAAFLLNHQQPGYSLPLAASLAVTATKIYTLAIDSDGDNQADPGDVLTYTIIITTNSSGTTSTSVVFSDTLDPATNLTGTINVSPLAFDDVYTTFGNTLLQVAAVPSSSPAITSTALITANDVEFLGDTFSLGSMNATSVNGGTVTNTGGGSFTYLPPTNFVGTDVFSYSLIDSGGLTGLGRISINVTERIWYVNNTTGGGTGRSNDPFDTLAAAQSASSAGDYIFVYRGDGTSTNYDAGIILKNNQKLIGQGTSLVISGTTVVAAGSNPVLANGAGDIITLAQNNLIQGLTANATINAGIFGNANIATANVSTVTINTSGSGDGVSLTSQTGNFNFSGSSITGNGSGAAVNLSGASGSGNATFTNSIINKTAGAAVNIQNKTGGTVTFSGGSVTANTGTVTPITLSSNTGAIINFSNSTLALTTTTATVFNATGGGTVSVIGSGNTLDSTTGTALNVANTTIGASGLTFQRIASPNSGANTGIILNTTGSSGGLTVTGGVTAGSGGTIANKTGTDGSTTSGIGIYLNSTASVSLARMQLNDFQNFAIRGVNVTGFTLNNSTINGLNGTNAGGSGEGSIYFDNLLGTASMANSTVSGALVDNVRVINTSGTLNALTISNCTILNNSNASGNIGVHIQGATSAVMTANVTNCLFQGNRTISLDADAADSSNITFTASGNTIIAGTGGNPQGNQGIEVSSSLSSQITFDLNNNKVGTDGVTNAPLFNHGINLFSGNNSTLAGKVTNNTIVNAGTGISGFGIRVFQSDNATLRANINGNSVSNVGLDFGIDVTDNGSSVGASTGSVQVAVKNNIVSVDASAIDAIRVRARRDTTMCAAISGNTASATGPGPFALDVSQANTAVYNLEIVPPPSLGALSAAQVQTELASLNPGATSVIAAAATNFIGVAVGSCNIP